MFFQTPHPLNQCSRLKLLKKKGELRNKIGCEKTHIKLKIRAFGFLNILYYFATNLLHVC
jgi:hypothetical protein